MINEEIRTFIQKALEVAAKENNWKIPKDFTVQIERPKNDKFGDWSSNLALVLSKQLKEPSKDIAEKVNQSLQKHKYVKKSEVAGPGFLNLYLEDDWYRHLIPLVIKAGESYGKTKINKGKINLEFVSANPVGPLHIGHGRWAAVGDALANILEATGYEVTKEFYVNDYGRQIKIFGASVSASPSASPSPSPSPDEAEIGNEEYYKGAYIDKIAETLDKRFGSSIFSDKERLQKEATAYELKEIGQTLENFSVKFDKWVNESTLHKSDIIDKTIKELMKKGYAYEKEDAIWFKSQELGDEKDRVLKRSNGEPTYFASDIAYHKDKLDRGFDKLINIWGADHHGYIPRIKAALKALKIDPDTLEVLLGQLVRLVKSGQPVKMSKRAGEYVTLDELVKDVGKDAVRYTFLTQSIDSNMDFDIDLAKEQSAKNPVYYVQYAYARICNVFSYAEEKGFKYEQTTDHGLITDSPEIKLLKDISRFEEVIQKSADKRAPHLLTNFAAELAASFHDFYTRCRIITPDNKNLVMQRLNLVKVAQITLKNLLDLLGVSAPEKM